jgi:CheY-like chemotaxis protein
MHMRVLIVDDYPDTAETTGELLASDGHEYRTAASGAEALAAVDAFDPELAILDIGLPDIDGYALLDALRSRMATRPPYTVAMTGWRDALSRAPAAGFDECLLKPARRDQLLHAVRLALSRRAAS